MGMRRGCRELQKERSRDTGAGMGRSGIGGSVDEQGTARGRWLGAGHRALTACCGGATLAASCQLASGLTCHSVAPPPLECSPAAHRPHIHGRGISGGSKLPSVRSCVMILEGWLAAAAVNP